MYLYLVCRYSNIHIPTHVYTLPPKDNGKPKTTNNKQTNQKRQINFTMKILIRKKDYNKALSVHTKFRGRAQPFDTISIHVCALKY